MSGYEFCSSFAVPIKSILCFFSIERAKYFGKLQNELRELRNYKEQLEPREQRVRRKINRGNALYERVEDEEKWVEQASRFQDYTSKMVKKAEEELRKKAITWFFPRGCFSYTKVGDQISSALKWATRLIEKDNFQTEPGNPANENCMPQKVVGFELKFEEIWMRIEDPAVEISGLYGRGGVGQTTLLRMIYDRLLKRSNVAIFVEMPKEDPVGVIQEAIRQNFAISQEYWEKKTGKDKDIIRKLLRKEKFYLLLGDVNAHHLGSNFLEEAGVPLDGNNNGSKVIFSTQSKEVCNKMRAEPIEVNTLTDKDGIELLEFYLVPGALKDHQQIRKFAVDVAQLCNGLPLMLTTVGGAMAGVIDPSQWIDAIQTLENDLSKFEDVETKVLNVLKFGYDMLRDDSSKNCCLYFSMLPEVKNIKVEELVEQWIGEGFLDESDDNIYVARKKGAKIIGDLKLVGLLERGESGDFIKMHDEIHRMALWLARQQRRVLVQHKKVDFAEWTDAEWILLFGPKIKITADEMPHRCHNLTTLLVKSTNLKTIPSGFFQSVPSLKVLDLSDNNSLAYLPIDIGELGNLQYLNLSGTSVEEFPAGVQNWKKSLRIFIVSARLIITREMISNLCLLRVIRMLSSMDDEIGILEELENLKHINEIGIVLSSPTSVQKLLDSPKLGGCIKELVVRLQSDWKQSSSFHLKLSPSKMEHLQRLELSGYGLNGVEIECEYDIEVDYFEQLRFVSISYCNIKNVNWLIHARHLQTLSVTYCFFMEEIVSSRFAEQVLGNAFGQHVFGCLTDLELRVLPKLRFICSEAITFLSLNRLLVDCCSKLCCLPFNSASAKNIKEIKGERNWWDSLQWDDNQIKEIFFLKCRFFQQCVSIRIDAHRRADRLKAMKIASGFPGVDSVSYKTDKNILKLLGDGLDVLSIVHSLIRNVGDAEIISIGLLVEDRRNSLHFSTSR